MRFSLFEFEDLKWFPDLLRESMTDYLRYFLNATNFYKPVTPLLQECLEQSGGNICVDLCSGGGGAIESVIRNLKSGTGRDVRFILTDKFPNLSAFSFLKEQLPESIDFIASSVDATRVPSTLQGVRTMYSALHHFDQDTVRAVLSDAVKTNTPIALFDGGDRSLLTILGIIIVQPITFFLCTPFFRPFKFSRIFYTYIIPLIPLCTIWDGVVSITRLYQPQELLKIAKEVEGDYEWKTGKVRNHLYMNITYLTGRPAGKEDRKDP